MKYEHYIILDKNNKPLGFSRHVYNDIDYKTNTEEQCIDLDKTYDYLWLWDSINDSHISFNKDEHRIFKAKVGSCNLNGGNGRGCQNVRFEKEEVNPDKIKFMENMDEHRFPITRDENGNITTKFYQTLGPIVYNSKCVKKLSLE